MEPIGDELLVFDQERRVAHSLNEVAARVWRACDGARDLVALGDECGVDEQTLRLALERLRDAQLLTDTEFVLTSAGGEPEGLSRRAMLRKSVLAGAGIGVAIPVIRSITAPSLAMAASSSRSGNQVKGKAGEHCTSSGQCSAGVSFCQGTTSCQRFAGQSCSHTSSCEHVAGATNVCHGGVCGPCTSNGQCPASLHVCHISGICKAT